MTIHPTVRLDRLIVVSWSKPGWKLPSIPGFKVVRDIRVRPQGESPRYERVRELLSLTSATRVSWQYRRRRGWLKEWRITIYGDYLSGITPMELLPILKRCRHAWLVLVELAMDFPPTSGVDRAFVKRHGVFGKSRRRTDRGGPGQLRYGSRKSAKLVRAYWKAEVSAFRVEVELHSRLLSRGRRERARKTSDELKNDVATAPYLLLPKHVCFMRFRWRALRCYLTRRFGKRGSKMFDDARATAAISLRAAARLLRTSGVNNVHRFLVPMRINDAIDDALTQWSLDFKDFRGRSQ
jgi:hypothetical protein